jgi:hypothetical protein
MGSSKPAPNEDDDEYGALLVWWLAGTEKIRPSATFPTHARIGAAPAPPGREAGD